jgi:thioredoxin reductase (NADPH)
MNSSPWSLNQRYVHVSRDVENGDHVATNPRGCRDMLDCLVIGGGPAGLLAAVYLARYRRSVRVIDAGESRAAKIPESHNYPGFVGIAGLEVLQRLSGQAREYGVELVNGRVTSLCKRGESFVATCSGSDVNARFILLATGLVDNCPSIEGQPAGCPSGVIRFCPICDGYEAMDCRVGVLGDIKTGGKKALFLRTYTRDVSLFLTDETEDVDWQEKLTKAGVRIIGHLKQIRQATPRAVTVVTHRGESHDLDALYPALGCTVSSNLATMLGALSTKTGNLEVDDHQRTTIEGLYAAGDVVTDLHQLSVAFGHAAIGATDIHNRLPPNPR